MMVAREKSVFFKGMDPNRTILLQWIALLDSSIRLSELLKKIGHAVGMR